MGAVSPILNASENIGAGEIPMRPEDDPDYTKNTKEQYEALGRFVEAFEAMVSEVREICIELLSKDGRHRNLIEVPFHLSDRCESVRNWLFWLHGCLVGPDLI